MTTLTDKAASFPVAGIVTPDQVKKIVVSETELITAKDLAKLRGSTVAATSSLLRNWKKSRATLILKYQGLNHCPLYTLNPANGYKPYPAISEIISILEQSMGPWQMTFWFMCATNYLSGKTPREMLALDGELVIQCAHHEIFGGLHG